MSNPIKVEATVKKVTSQKGGNEILMNNVTAKEGQMEILSKMAGNEARVMITLTPIQQELPSN